jgi:hypothetical protein
MGRKSIINSYIGKEIGGVKILKSLDVRKGRLFVECQCSNCNKIFEVKFHNVYKGNYKSCGCQQFQKTFNNPRWKGIGEISGSYFYSLKRGAKSRNLQFEITLDEIWNLFQKQNYKCALSGVDLKFNSNRKAHDGNASLDRIDSSFGYIITNVQWIDKEVNYAKQEMTNEQFIKMCKKVTEKNK